MREAEIIVLAGQSNAVGVGHARFLEHHFSEEQIKTYYTGYSTVKINYFSHDKKSGGFVDTTVGCTEMQNETVGPELGIAQWLSENTRDKNYFIVKCAFGGTSLYHDWLSPSGGAAYGEDTCADTNRGVGWCYNELIRIVQDSITTLEGNGFVPRIKAFCWMQGESDAFLMKTVEQYGRLYDALLDDFGKVFCAYLDDTSVYVDGGISETWPFYQEMNKVKLEYATIHKNCYYIDTIGAGLTVLNEPDEQPDIYHYDSDSIIKLGWLFAQAIMNPHHVEEKKMILGTSSSDRCGLVSD